MRPIPQTGAKAPEQSIAAEGTAISQDPADASSVPAEGAEAGEAELLAALEDAEFAALRVVAQMDRNLDLLRACNSKLDSVVRMLEDGNALWRETQRREAGKAAA